MLTSIFSAEEWKQEADLAVSEGASMNYSLELAIFFDDNYLNQLDDLIAGSLREPYDFGCQPFPQIRTCNAGSADGDDYSQD